MYTTKRLSHYKNSPQTLSLPPEGPNSGYLVVQDDESTPTRCFGLSKDTGIDGLPFPQNKCLSVRFTVATGYSATILDDDVYLIPVINQPLSSNRYYVVDADGKHKGESYASSKDQDKTRSCFCIPRIRDVKPRPPFDPKDPYQQFEFSTTKTCSGSNRLTAKSVPNDGHPPDFLRRKGWYMVAKPIKDFTMREANGIDSSLRQHLPDFSFPPSQERSKSVVVGKWYCPFMFVKEGKEMDQVKNSVFYEMTLEQRWERIFAAEQGNNKYSSSSSSSSSKNNVSIDVVVPAVSIRIEGQHTAEQQLHNDGGMVYFKSIDQSGVRVGVSALVVERMMWEESRVGWVDNKKQKQVSVVRNEEYGGVGDWTSFGCYMLIESFVLKRFDGSVVLTYDFKHFHQIRSKWVAVSF